jgi:hypothetical protein
MEMLVANHYYEVRDNFMKLLISSIGMTAKNEEGYFFENETLIDFDHSVNGVYQEIKQSKSCLIRFVKLLIEEILEETRGHWKYFDEFFQVLKYFAELGYLETTYLVESKLILRLIDFLMNNSMPFYHGSSKPKMGDVLSEPNFAHVMDLLALLVKSTCIVSYFNRLCYTWCPWNYEVQSSVTIPIE